MKRLFRFSSNRLAGASTMSKEVSFFWTWFVQVARQRLRSVQLEKVMRSVPDGKQATKEASVLGFRSVDTLKVCEPMDSE